MGIFQQLFVVVALCVAASYQQSCSLTSNQDVAPGSDIGSRTGQPLVNFVNCFIETEINKNFLNRSELETVVAFATVRQDVEPLHGIHMKVKFKIRK